ncbi:MAG: glycosyltransferase family A protein [Melioribacteraceae bacterium]
MPNISVFLPSSNRSATLEIVNRLKESECVKNIFILPVNAGETAIEGTTELVTDRIESSETIRLMAERCGGDYVLIMTRSMGIEMSTFAIERMLHIAEDTGAGLLYSDYFEIKNGEREIHPTTDYQTGSVRDDFDFGPLLLINPIALRSAAKTIKPNHKFAGLYNLRLNISRDFLIMRIPEYLYTYRETDIRSSGQKQFDYVNPRNRAVQIEMEETVTGHLKKIDALLEPPFLEIDDDESNFDFEASVIIPVKNRIKTIGDAVKSALNQKTDFRFNVIVVDNHSDDGTTELLGKFSADNKNLIHIIPERKDLLIGGCWNLAVKNNLCGKYAIQLDSDDLFKDENAIQSVVDLFVKEKCGMVIGSYLLTDFALREIEPGLVDHREWSPENGPNNALRINGLGAPRAFYTPLIRKTGIPNVSYGEDYFLGLRISRDFKIGRIYNPIYLCRRWEENTDSALTIQKQNMHNIYKDRLRTFEILSRINKNRLK